MFRQERLDDYNSDQSGNSGSSSLPKEFDTITELINIKVNDILSLKFLISVLRTERKLVYGSLTDCSRLAAAST